jgi:hypothetical protein
MLACRRRPSIRPATFFSDRVEFGPPSSSNQEFEARIRPFVAALDVDAVSQC